MISRVKSMDELRSMAGKPVYGRRNQNEEERWYLVYTSNSDALKDSGIVTLLDSDGFLHDIREDHFQFWRLGGQL